MRTSSFAMFGGSLLFLGGLAAAPAQATDWPQFGFGGKHSGFNTDENTISAANVSQLVALYPDPIVLPAIVDGAPVYLAGVATPGGTKNLLFLFADNMSKNCSSTGYLVAIDADDGSTVWSKETSGCQPATASPATDPDRLYVYSYGLDGKVHKYQVGDGTEITSGGWPETITLKTNVEKGASSLTIANSGSTNYLIAVTDGYIGDGGDYQGHLVSINLANGSQTVFNAMCSDQSVHLGDGACAYVQSGIWGRGGATFNAATDRVYIATGNGHFQVDSSHYNWGDSVLALAVDGSGNGGGMPRDSYTPANFQQLDDQDLDLGSISPAILPVPANSTVAHLGMQVGKDAVMRLIDLDNMSGTGAPGHVGGELQLLAVPQGGIGMREQPAVWVSPTDHSTWVFVANGSGISGVQLGLNQANQPLLTTRWTKTTASTSPIVANGVLYNVGACNGGTCVIGRNPLTGNVGWTSPPIGPVHWQSPIIVDGAIYVTNNNAKLYKFGLPGDVIFDDGFDGNP